MHEIVIYSSSICPYCKMAKKLLDKKSTNYTELNVDSDPELRSEMVQRTMRRTVPQIFIGDKHVGGFDDLYTLEVQNELDSLLLSS